MARPPESTNPRRASAWPPGQASAGHSSPASTLRWHGEFAYVADQFPGGTTLPLMRLHYAGSAATWGFAIYSASHDDYETPYCPAATRPTPAGSPRLRLRVGASTSATLRLGSTRHPDELTGGTSNARPGCWRPITSSAASTAICTCRNSAQRSKRTSPGMSLPTARVRTRKRVMITGPPPKFNGTRGQPPRTPPESRRRRR